MSAPYDAPYKVQQRDLKARLRIATRPPMQTPATSLLDVSRFWLGQHTNSGRRSNRAVFIKANGVRQWKRLQQSVRRLFPVAA